MDKNKSEIYGVNKVSHKGKINLPAKLRHELGIDAGDFIQFSRDKNGKIYLKKLDPTSE